jgi:hypothetical protein
VEKGTKDCVHALNVMAHHRETPGFLRRMEFMGGTASIAMTIVVIVLLIALIRSVVSGGGKSDDDVALLAENLFQSFHQRITCGLVEIVEVLLTPPYGRQIGNAFDA